MQLFEELVAWCGILIMESIDATLDFDESLWDADPDLCLLVADQMDIEGMLVFGGCLDAPVPEVSVLDATVLEAAMSESLSA